MSDCIIIASGDNELEEIKASEAYDRLRKIINMFEAYMSKDQHDAHIALIEAELENIRKDYPAL
jgi:hypothetical protein